MASDDAHPIKDNVDLWHSFGSPDRSQSVFHGLRE